MQKLFSNSIRAEGILCKHARGISERSGKEFHLFHEIIYFLGGDAEFISENLHMGLKPETLILIPKETYHQMIIHGDQQCYYRCLLQFPDSRELSGLIRENMTGILAFSADREIKYLFGKLITACSEGEPVLLKAVLTLLLDSLKSKSAISGEENLQTDLIKQATGYINQNIAGKILIADIAAQCHVSESTLCHVFKKEMNIPIHKFIIKKRLVSAHHKIASGRSATAAALECGFNDYSGFYKQYKKAFGFSPSKNNGQK